MWAIYVKQAHNPGKGLKWDSRALCGQLIGGEGWCISFTFVLSQSFEFL